MTTKSKTKAVIYARFSPRPNADESQSAEKQEEICRTYCDRKGYEVAGVFIDRSQSGDDADREGLWEAVEAVKRGQVLVVRWRNRLARDVYLAETIRRSVEKKGARIEAAEEANGGSPDDVFIQQVLAAFAQREKKIIALRTKYAMLRHQRNGRIMSKHLPYGFRKAEKKGYMEPDPDEQIVVEIIVELHNDGMPYNAIATRLNDRGISPRTADFWTAKTVRAIVLRTKRQ